MNERDLLFAIAGTNGDLLAESGMFDTVSEIIRSRQKRIRRGIAAIGAALALCIAAFAIWRQTPQMPGDVAVAPPQTTENGAAHTAPNEITEQTTADPGPTAATTAEQPPQTTDADEPEQSTRETPSAEPATAAEETAPTEEDPPAPPAETTTGTPVPGGEPGTANAVLTQLAVDYETAKETFAHPIVRCAAADFTGYRIGVVSRQGDSSEPGAVCVSLEYDFADGYIALQDQDRTPGSVASEQGARTEYRGRVFYVWTYDGGGIYEDRQCVGYFPTGDGGVAYQAFFSPGKDVYEIMDLIISVVI